MTQARILIVENDPEPARLLEAWLHASRYRHIGTATSGHEAITLAGSTRPDLVIMDTLLPGVLDGIETAGILLERFDLPVLYLTELTDEVLFEHARTTSPAACLTKPFNERELGRAVEVALDRHALLRRLKASEAQLAEARKTEKRLEQGEARYRSLVESLPDAILVTQDDQVIYVNPAAVELAGVQNANELQGKSEMNLVHPDTRHLFEHRKPAALAAPSPPIASSLMRNDGSAIEVESESFAFEYDNRPAVLTVMRDLTERRRMERAADRFRVALDSSPDAIFLLDPVAQRFIDANEAACKTLGYTHEELLARGPHDLKPHFNQTSLGERFDQVWSGTPGAEVIQAIHQRKDGSTFPVEVSLRPFEAAENRLMVAVARDITMRQLAETQLKETNERFQQFVENVNEVFWIRDLEEDCFLYVSPAFETLFRKPVSSVYHHSRAFVSAVHPDDLERVTSAFAWQDQHRQGCELMYRIIVGDNVIRWLWVRTFPIPDEQGKVYRMAGIAEDMTRRREYDEQYRAVIQTSLDSFLVMNVQGRLVDCNDAYNRVVGYTREELLQLSITDLEHNESPEHTAEHVRRVIERGQDRFETRHRHKNGQLIDMEVSVHYRPDSRGGRLFAFLRDISLRKQAEIALIESEANLERAQSIAQIGSWKLDLRTNQLAWSEETHRIFGITVGTPLTLERFLGCVHPDDREAVGSAWNAALNGTPYDIEHRIQVGGEIKWVHEQAEIRLNAEGQPVIGFGSVQDVTQSKQVELALRRSEARSRSILRVAPVGIGVLAHRVFQEVNEAMTRITGYSTEELLGQSARMLYPTQADFDYVGAEKYQQIQAYGIGSVETRWRRKDGRIIDIALSSSPIEADDLAQGVTFTAQDITASKQAEQARQTHEASQRNALVREVHHRIKNNLQGVIGLLRQHIVHHPDTLPAIEAAIAQVNTIAIVHGLQSRMPQQELRLRELLHEVNDAAAAMAMVSHPPSIKDTLSGCVWLDSGAAVTIALILNELIHNAFKHGLTVDGTGVEIALSGDDKLTLIYIKNPCGPLPESLDLSTGKGCGTGLDLVRTLLPRYGAQLNLYKEREMIHVELVLSAPVIHAVGSTDGT